MASTIGRLEEFDYTTDDWTTYAERIEHYFKANNVAEDKKKDALLASIGGKTFTLLRSLTAPGKPGDKQYEELVELLRKHLNPKPIVISERFRFFKRDQREGESIKQYAAELQKLTEHCNFGPALNEALRDRLICGMRNQSVQKRLLVKADLDFAKALEIAEMEEIAIKDASELQLQAKPELVHHIEKPARTTNGMRSKDQLTDMSRPKEIRCWVCGKSGHIARMCRNKGKVQRRTFQQSRNSRETHAISEESESQSDSEVTGHFNVVNWLRVDLLRKTRENKPMLIKVTMEGKGLEMEVDTGAAVSILPYREYERSFSHLALKPSRVKLKTYSGERITPKGELTVDVKIKGRIYYQLPLIVVDSPGPPLLGQEWMRVVSIEWRDINHMELKQEQKAEMEGRLKRLKERYSSVFEDCLGKLVGMKARLTLKPDATPRFVKARPVPYTMRPKIEKELEKLQQIGVLSPVTWSEWATPCGGAKA